MNPTKEMIAIALQEKLNNLNEKYQDELHALTSDLAQAKRRSREEEDLARIANLKKKIT